jgi:hypothetical protein
MSKGPGAAPTPSSAIGDAANRQIALGEEWLQFSKDQFAISKDRQAEIDALTKSVAEKTLKLAEDNSAYTRAQTDKSLAIAEEQLGLGRQVAQKQLDSADWQDGIARADRERYESVYRPVEDQFIEEASTYGSPERQAEAAAAAMADVRTAGAASRSAAQREAASLGINPNSGRWGGISRAGDLGESLATAGAANAARTAVRDKGLSLKADIANLGRGVSAQALNTAAGATNTQNSALNASNAGAGMAIGAGNNAISNMGAAAGGEAAALGTGLTGALNANNAFLGSTGIVGQGFAGATSGNASGANTLNNLFNSQYGIYADAQNRSDANLNGFMGALGTGAGLLLSSEEVKEDKAEIPEGEALEAVKELPVESWRYKEGYGDDGAAEHIGTYAEDFQAETGQGDGKTIPVGDAIGLTMKAVKDLAVKVDSIESAVGLGASGRRRAPAGRTPPPPASRPAGKPPRRAEAPIGLGFAAA